MTSEDLKAELEKEPFIAIRLHLVSGKTVDVTKRGQAELLQNALLVFRERSAADGETLYDSLSLRNIERIEQLSDRR